MGDWQAAADTLLTACCDTFGVPVTYTLLDGEAVTITAIFDEHAEIITTAAAGLPVSSSQTVLDVRLVDLPALPQEGDGVTVGSSNFRVADIQSDGVGSARLLLHRQ